MQPADSREEKLTADEAEQLVRQFKQTGSLALRNRLVLYYSYIIKGIVARMGNTYYKYASAEEMLHQGVIALIDSLERFDPDKDVKFSTYAFTRVRGAMIDYVRKQDWLPRRVRQEHIRIHRIEKELTSELGRTPTRNEMAKAAGMTPEAYDRCILEISGESLSSFEALLESPSQSRPFSIEGDSFDPQEQVDRKELRRLLAEAIDHLNEQERTVLSLYYYENLTMKEIGRVMQVSEQRIGQINRKLIGKLRASLAQYIGGSSRC